MNTWFPNCLTLSFRKPATGILITILILFFSADSYTQEHIANVPRQPRNTLFVEGLGASVLGFSFNYRRSFILDEKTALSASAGIGKSFDPLSSESVSLIPVAFTVVFGRKHALEAGPGFTYVRTENYYYPTLMAGYRLLKRSCYFWAGVVLTVVPPVEKTVRDPISEAYSSGGFAFPMPGIHFGFSF